MKKLTLLLLIPLLLSSCVIETDEADIVPLSESLKISTYLVAKEYADIGYLDYVQKPKKAYGDIQWTLYETGEVIPHNKSYVYEQLSLNEPRLTAPMGYGGYNLIIDIESEGIIQIEHHKKHDNDTLLMNYKVDDVNWSSGNVITHVGPVTLSVCPVGKFTSFTGLLLPCTLADREYYIDIKTYTLDGRPKVTAQLKLTAVKDEYYPSDEIAMQDIYTTADEKTRYFEIELVKYSYSEAVLHDEFERYDHLYN